MRQAREIVSRFYESFDSGDIDTMVAGFSDELETTDPGMGTVHGLAPFREYPETLKRACPTRRRLSSRRMRRETLSRPARASTCDSRTSRASARARSSPTTPTTTSSAS